MRAQRVMAALLVSAAMTGCGGSSAADGPADALWAARTPYVGDSSRVTALVHAVDPAPDGTYSIRLSTGSPPYALDIALDSTAKPFAQKDFRPTSTLLLGLVANLDEVAVTFQGQRSTLTRAAASEELGYDVKELGRSRQRLTDYVQTTRD